MRLAGNNWHIDRLTRRENEGTMAYSDWKPRNAAICVCALLMNGIGVCIAYAQAPALVYKTQIYGHGNAASLPGAGEPNLGRNAMAVDATGNIYVTGSTSNGLNSDFLTVKYNAAGLIQWRAVTNGGANGNDFAYAIALDTNGNVLVTGSSQSGAQSDYLTVKYDPTGVELWRVTMDRAANGDEEAYALAVDAGGNVIVTGTSNYDYLTVKYSPAGVETWRQPMSGGGNGMDRSVALCLDASGNAVVTGYSFNNFNFNFDYVTVKYLAIGAELWKRPMNSNANGNDVAYSMACDSSGNIYVTGKSGDGINANYLTVKYNANGIEQWPVPAVTNGIGNSADTSFAIALDNVGDVIVTGLSNQDNSGVVSVTNPAHLTVKYNGSSGAELWRATLNGSGTGGIEIYTALATDGAGNVYASGFANNPGNNGNNELVVVKYAPTGNLGAGTIQWQKFVNGVGTASGVALLAINVDASGNVVAAGYQRNGQQDDFLVVKFDSTGQQLWSTNEGEHTGLTTTLASGATGRNALAVDSGGNVYVSGQSGLATNSDFIIAKINDFGVEQWRAVLNGSAGGVDRAYAVAVDGNGNVYAAGDSFAGGYSDFMTVKYDASGAEQWRTQPGNALNTFNNSIRALAVDPTGGVIVTGYTAAGADFLTIKYSANGVEQWKRTVNGAANGDDTPVAMAVDAAGNIFIVGRSFDGAYDGYLTMRYNYNDTSSGGPPQRRAVLNGSASAPRQPFAIAVDATGNVIVTGDSTVKYSPDGIEQWHTTDTFRAYAIALGADGTIVVGGTGGLIVKYDGNGGEKWRRAINGAVDGNDVVYALTVDIDGSVYATGRNAVDYLTVKLGADGNERWRFTTLTAGGGVSSSPALVLDASRKLILAGNAVTGGLPAAIMIAKFSQTPPVPTGVTAIAGNAEALVSFVATAATESPISGYIVTCQTGSVIVAGSSSPILVTGLSNNVAYACSVAATNAFGTGLASAAASVTPTANPPIALFGVKSSKTHGSAVDFAVIVDFAQALGDAVTVEPRTIGAGHKLVFHFNNTVSATGTVNSIDANSNPIGSASAMSSGNDVVVTLTGIPDNQRVRVTFSVTGVNGSTNAAAALGFLVGDVSSMRSVNAADISAVKARIGQSIGLANFKFDVDASGSIDASDLLAVKTRSGLTLP